MISDAIDSYLKDVEPPQREPKTYDEYRLVLYKFHDTCKKRYVEEVDRDDLLDFRRVLYSLGNEARTVFNRMGIVLQLLKIFGIEKLLKKETSRNSFATCARCIRPKISMPWLRPVPQMRNCVIYFFC